MSAPLRALGLAVAAAVFFLLFMAGGEWADRYQMRYGVFNPSQGELALKLHGLVFLLPASLLLAATVAQIPALWRPLGRGFDALPRGLGQLWPAVAALLVLLLAAFARLWVLRDSPVTDDENAYLFAAELLTRGLLYAESAPPAVRAFFDNQFIVNNGRWFGMYFIGHPAALAVAGRFGMAGWVGPIDAALTVLAGIGIARRAFGERAAVLTGALLVLSPFLILLSATQLSQPTSSLALALAVYAMLRIEAAPRNPAWWALAAAAISAAFLVRPQAGLVLSAPVLARLGWLAFRARPAFAGPAVFSVVASAGALLFLWVNWALTGNPFQTSYHVYWRQVRLINWRNSPLYPFRELGQSMLNLNTWLFGWPLSLALAPFFARQGPAWVLAAMPLAAITAQAAIGVSTVAAVGPVYFGECIVPLAALSASGFERVVMWTRLKLGADALASRSIVAWPIAMVAVSLLTFVPLQVRSLRAMSAVVRAPYDLVERHRLDSAVVFVHSLPALSWRPGAWVYYHRNNAPDLSDPVLFVRDLGSERNQMLARRLPGRTPYLMRVQGSELLLAPLGHDGAQDCPAPARAPAGGSR